MSSLDETLRARLEELERLGLRRRLRTLEAPGTTVRLSGRAEPVLNFCSNDYLGFSTHPALLEAVKGAGSPSSRLIAGNLLGHVRAEETLAEFVGLPAATLFSSGYAANVGIVSSLMGEDDVVFSDRLIHASLIDGARLSRAKVVVVDHASVHGLSAALKKHRGSGRALVLTDSLVSLDVDAA